VPKSRSTLDRDVVMPEETRSRAWLRSIRLSGFSILVLAIIVLFLVVLAPGLKTLLEQRAQIADLEQSVALQQQQVEQLREERARWDDPAYIKAQARDRLFYVMPGEYPYLIIDDVPVAANQQPTTASADLQETRSDWVQSLFDSYLAAGLSDAPAPEAAG
jgi:cell division protein FtsB